MKSIPCSCIEWPGKYRTKAFTKITTGLLAREAENPARGVAKITDDKTTEIDVMTTEVSIEHLENIAKQDKLFLMSIQFGKNHQPNKPAKAFKGASSAES